MTLTPEETEELRRLEAALEMAGGRGVDIAERIDELRRKNSPKVPVRFKADCTAYVRETWECQVPTIVTENMDEYELLDYLADELRAGNCAFIQQDVDGEHDRDIDGDSIEVILSADDPLRVRGRIEPEATDG